jgi:exonuclease VII small subunit
MRTYDNGTVSANRSAQYLQAVHDRIRKNASLSAVPAAKTIEELAGDFFEKTSAYRAAVEFHRIRNATDLFPDADGLPARNFRAYAGYALRNLFRSPDTLGTEAAQLKSATELGDAVDMRITASGGLSTDILRARDRYATTRRLNESVVALDESMRDYHSAIGLSKYCPTGALDRALTQLAKTMETVGQSPELAEKFPVIDGKDISAGFIYVRGHVLRHLEAYIDALGELRDEFNEFDVMRDHQELWQKRAEACASQRLGAEAAICLEVAEQFDHTYFEGLQKAWSERSISTYSPR